MYLISYLYIYIYTYKCVVLSSVFYIVFNDSIVSKTIIRRTSAHEENIARIFIVAVVVVVVVIIIVIHRFDRHSRHIDMSVCVSRRWRESQLKFSTLWEMRMCETTDQLQIGNCAIRPIRLCIFVRDRVCCVRACAPCGPSMKRRTCVCVFVCARAKNQNQKCR